MIQAQFEESFDSFRNLARNYIQKNIPPEEILWTVDEAPSFFSMVSAESEPIDPLQGNLVSEFRVPSEFITLARFVSCYRKPHRWNLLYRLLYRLKNETSDLLKIATDPDVREARVMMKSVTHDIHKMHAFVRFKHVVKDHSEIYVAWHRPEHLILEEAAPFFMRRFGDKPWCIMTPDKSAYWDMKDLHYGEGIPQHEFQVEDHFDELWKTYYSSIFNPARIKIKAMKKEMAPKYWSTLPEAELISGLIQQAPQRLQEMAKNQNRQAEVPQVVSLKDMNALLTKCQACPLFAPAAQVVLGEGPTNSPIMFVGEQPGDQEDQMGRPFIGPAGELLNERLLQLEWNRNDIYLTNAVKHFKFERVGKLRKHKKASGTEMHACKPWLEKEIEIVKPRVIVALGLTAATSLLGRLPRLTEERGKVIRGLPFAEAVILSWHPAAILRAFSEDEAREKKEQLLQDLKLAKSLLPST